MEYYAIYKGPFIHAIGTDRAKVERYATKEKGVIKTIDSNKYLRISITFRPEQIFE